MPNISTIPISVVLLGGILVTAFLSPLLFGILLHFVYDGDQERTGQRTTSQQ